MGFEAQSFEPVSVLIEGELFVRCIKHFDVLTVGFEGVFITVNMFLKSNG